MSEPIKKKYKSRGYVKKKPMEVKVKQRAKEWIPKNVDELSEKEYKKVLNVEVLENKFEVIDNGKKYS